MSGIDELVDEYGASLARVGVFCVPVPLVVACVHHGAEHHWFSALLMVGLLVVFFLVSTVPIMLFADRAGRLSSPLAALYVMAYSGGIDFYLLRAASGSDLELLGIIFSLCLTHAIAVGRLFYQSPGPFVPGINILRLCLFIFVTTALVASPLLHR